MSQTTCPSCRQPTTPRDLVLWSGVCKECKTTGRDDRADHVEDSKPRSVVKGQTPAAVVAELVKHGQKDQEALFDHAIQALAAGSSSDEVESGLLARGASPELAKLVQREAGRLIRREVRKVGHRRRTGRCTGPGQLN